jgi:hypothetical protein
MKTARSVTLPTGLLQVQVDQARFALDTLVGFAARANAKRGFLFLSKVLGKHWPVAPHQMRAIHRDLAAQIPADLPGPVLFIALAETAIGLGQGVFEAYLTNQPAQPEPQEQQPRHALFLHSSRYRVGDGPMIEFEEAHSHAPRQFLHVPSDPALRHLLHTARSLVLVDDEASTGNTFVNLCHALRSLNPALARVHLALITNFMGQAANAALPQRFGLPVTVGAALDGEYHFAPGTLASTDAPAQRFDASAERGASSAFGRLGLAHALPVHAANRLAAQLTQQIAPGEPVLVLGTGEFMHPAFLLASALENLGHQVAVQATTRSPILVWGAVTHQLQFTDNYGEGIANYLYNVAPACYRHVLICHETPATPALMQLAVTLAGRLFHFQSENDIEEIPVR